MRSSLRLIFLAACVLLSHAGWRGAEPCLVPGGEAPLSSSEFARLIEELSEPEGFFDSDNFISNEAGYLKVLPLLRQQGLGGGVYIGVGPDQNYSYIAEIRPRLAILVDIRRQNLIQHLYFKALFQLSSNRAQFLERLFGRRMAEVPGDPAGASIEQLLFRIDRAIPNPGFRARAIAEAEQAAQSWKVPLTAEDLERLRHVARAFFADGPDLRFTSRNRPPRRHHPAYRILLLETDSEGRQSNYLASEERFRAVRLLQRRNRLVPVVGDLAGPDALQRIARMLRACRAEVGCFYLSNVEFYLFRGGRWQSYLRNMQLLPWSDNAILIRSYANAWDPHPAGIPGYYMTTLLQLARRFFENESAGRNGTYRDLVTHDYIAPRPQ